MPNLVGEIIQERYSVHEFLGRGGMAEVYKVWDNQRMTYLAMKILLEDLALDRVFIRRFTREANTLANLQHPNIVRFFDFEKIGRAAFMLMDYIEGETLKHFIHDAAGKSMPYGQIRVITRSVCGALHYAHSQGLVHCDIKPANIMIDQSGVVQLADFGIARVSDAATATMVGMGTPAYMAPEQIVGQYPLPQTDIYALGVVLYEMFTGGERPFTGDQAQITGGTSEKVRWEHINLQPPSPRAWNPSLSPEIEAVILKCLAKSPQERFQSALALFNALERAMGDVPDIIPVVQKKKKSIAPTINSQKKQGRGQIKQNLFGLASLGVVLLFMLGFAVSKITGDGNLSSSSPPVAVPTWTLLASGDNSSLTPPTEEQETVEVVNELPTSTPSPILTATIVPTNTMRNPYGTIAFETNRDGDKEIYLMDAFGNIIENLTSDSQHADVSPSWSPDGNYIAFSSYRNDNNDLFIINVKTHAVQQLTTNKATDWYPAWSPQGRYIAFYSNRDNSDMYNFDIYLYDTQTGNETAVVRSASVDGQPMWSPDGKQLVFQRYVGKNPDIFVMNIDGSSVRNLTNHPESDRTPAWSPDGRYVVFASDQDGDLDIYVMDLNTNEVTNLTKNSDSDRDPSWSPDGEYIIFETDRDGGNWEIYRMRKDGSDATRLTNSPGNDWGAAWYGN